jgi:hypothetical protein
MFLKIEHYFLNALRCKRVGRGYVAVVVDGATFCVPSPCISRGPSRGGRSQKHFVYPPTIPSPVSCFFLEVPDAGFFQDCVLVALLTEPSGFRASGLLCSQ